jgi:hypothetical protein
LQNKFFHEIHFQVTHPLNGEPRFALSPIHFPSPEGNFVHLLWPAPTHYRGEETEVRAFSDNFRGVFMPNHYTPRLLSQPLPSRGDFKKKTSKVSKTLEVYSLTNHI